MTSVAVHQVSMQRLVLVAVMCRQVDLGLHSPQNLQSPSTATLILQQQFPKVCKSQPQLVPGIASDTSSLWEVSNDTYVAVPSLERFGQQALQIKVGIGLPDAPRLIQAPQWNVTLSGPVTIGLSGSVDKPAIVYYAVCFLFELTTRLLSSRYPCLMLTPVQALARVLHEELLHNICGPFTQLGIC
jgi:hypothetical protein